MWARNSAPLAYDACMYAAPQKTWACLKFFTPDFIMYNLISTNAISPTMPGTACLSIANLSTYPFQTAIIHTIPKRLTDAKPKIIKPIQNTKVFSPSNTSHHRCYPCFVVFCPSCRLRYSTKVMKKTMSPA